MALGGRHYRGDSLDQNFDTYAVEYTFPTARKLFFDGRNMAGCHDEFASYAHGVQGLGGDLDALRTRPARRGSTRARRSRASRPRKDPAPGSEPGLGVPAAGEESRTSGNGTT